MSAFLTSDNPNHAAGLTSTCIPAFTQRPVCPPKTEQAALHLHTRLHPLPPHQQARASTSALAWGGVNKGNAMKNDYEIRGDVTVIFLQERDGKRIETLIDTEDLPKLLEIPVRWYAKYDKTCQRFYAQAKVPKSNGRVLLLHRVITDAPKGMHVDHINHDGLDNRKAMLRLATYSENGLNRRGPSRHSKSGIRGVYWHKGNRHWRAQIRINGRAHDLGGFRDIEDARSAYENALSRVLHGMDPRYSKAAA